MALNKVNRVESTGIYNNADPGGLWKDIWYPKDQAGRQFSYKACYLAYIKDDNYEYGGRRIGLDDIYVETNRKPFFFKTFKTMDTHSEYTHMQISYPVSFGLPERIIDPVNNFDYTPDFKSLDGEWLIVETTIDGMPYYVYTMSHASKSDVQILFEKDKPQPIEYGSISGVVTDESSHNPISEGIVRLNGSVVSATNDNGEFLLEQLLPGEYQLSISKADYQSKTISVTVIANTTTTVEITLQPSTVTVQKLIDLGYAVEDENARYSADGATVCAVQILNTCPYSISQISDFDDYISGTTENHHQIFIWKDALPQNWDSTIIAAKYNNKTLPIPPKAGLFWGLNFQGITNLTLTFSCGVDGRVVDYPWGGAWSTLAGDGIFSQRNQATPPQPQHLPTPENVTIILNGWYTSVFQQALNWMSTTKNITLLNNGGWNTAFAVHDCVGMFEDCRQLESITFGGTNGGFNMGGTNGYAINNMAYICNNCYKLTEFPLGYPSENRDSAHNTITPNNKIVDGQRLGAVVCLQYAFAECDSLTSIKPKLVFTYIEQQVDTLFNGCNNLVDMHIYDLSCDWDFSKDCPKLNEDTITYILNNIHDYSSGSTHTVTFSNLYESDIDQSVIDAAENKGWIVNFE